MQTRTTHALLFSTLLLYGSIANSAVIRISENEFNSSSGIITFDEYALGTENPIYTSDVYGGNVSSPTISFGGYFEGQYFSANAEIDCPGASATGCVSGAPDAPLVLDADSPKTFISNDGAAPNSPVLSGSPIFNGPIAIHFDQDVAAVGFDAGFFDSAPSTAITAFARDGTFLGTVLNEGTGIEFLGLRTDKRDEKIAGVFLDLARAEPAGFAIDSVRFGGSEDIEGIQKFLLPLSSSAPITLNTESGGVSAFGWAATHAPNAANYSLDFDVTTGSAEILAAADGTITSMTAFQYNYGTDEDPVWRWVPSVVIDHGDGYFTQYLEFDTAITKEDALGKIDSTIYALFESGQTVTVNAGDVIGTMDMEQYTHLHFQVKYDDTPGADGTGLGLSTVDNREHLDNVVIGGMFFDEYILLRSGDRLPVTYQETVVANGQFKGHAANTPLVTPLNDIPTELFVDSEKTIGENLQLVKKHLEVHIANEADGILVFKDGGKAEIEGMVIGFNKNGEVIVDGENSSLDAGRFLEVGGGGLGILRVRDKGLVKADTVVINNNGSLYLNGLLDSRSRITRVEEGGLIAPGQSVGVAEIIGDLIVDGVIQLEIENGLRDEFRVSGSVIIGQNAIFEIYMDILVDLLDINSFFTDALPQSVSGFSVDNIMLYTDEADLVGSAINVLYGGLVVERTLAFGTTEDVPNIPEPATVTLLALGLFGVRCMKRKAAHQHSGRLYN